MPSIKQDPDTKLINNYNNKQSSHSPIKELHNYNNNNLYVNHSKNSINKKPSQLNNNKNLDKYLINPNDIFNTNNNNNTNNTLSDDKIIIKKEKIENQNNNNNNNNVMIKKKKKKFLNISDPGKFLFNNNLLYEKNTSINIDNINNHILNNQNIDSNEITIYKKFINLDINDWILNGESIINDINLLILKLINERILLSIKFNSIVKIINNRAEFLMNLNLLIDEKLIKIKSLANEILKFI